MHFKSLFNKKEYSSLIRIVIKQFQALPEVSKEDPTWQMLVKDIIEVSFQAGSLEGLKFFVDYPDLRIISNAEEFQQFCSRLSSLGNQFDKLDTNGLTTFFKFLAVQICKHGAQMTSFIDFFTLIPWLINNDNVSERTRDLISIIQYYAGYLAYNKNLLKETPDIYKILFDGFCSRTSRLYICSLMLVFGHQIEMKKQLRDYHKVKLGNEFLGEKTHQYLH